MLRLYTSLLSLCFSSWAFAQTCPRLEGRFECRGNPQFELGIRMDNQNGLTVYSFSDPVATQNIVPDGQLHEMQFSTGQGTYTASCLGTRLLTEAHSPTGVVNNDVYYIERAALVRVRASGGRATSLSCRPIAGTWHLYPH